VPEKSICQLTAARKYVSLGGYYLLNNKESIKSQKALD
jgi:hypothetical protein